MNDRRIINVLIVLSVMFLCLIGYLTYIELALEDEISQNPYNQRQWAYEADIDRGMILDRNGMVLAESEDGSRIYKYGSLYSHVIGYNSQIYGKSMLEKDYNKILLGQYGIGGLNLTGGNKKGYNLYLTIDHQLQKKASELMGRRSGSAVALNPKTGEILAMVSKPDFDPDAESLEKNWTKLIDDEGAPLFPRAVSGLYAPGSTFKIITTAAALQAGLGDSTFTDTGKITIDGKEFANSNSRAHGKLDLTAAFKVSSNVAFCSLGVSVGEEKMRATAEKFGFNLEPNFDFTAVKSRYPTSIKGDADLASTAMGQGEVLATPLQMAMVAAAIANNGVMMKPYLVEYATNGAGVNIMENKPTALGTTVSEQIAGEITKMMVETVRSGTGTSAIINGITVAGKTGTAENEQTVMQKNKEHTWFVAFAPAENPEIAVAVMLEYSGGSGSAVCGPIVKNIIRTHFGK